MFVKISAKPVDIVLVQLYMSTTIHDEDEIEKLYEEGRGQVNAIVKGDFKSIVGEGYKYKVVGLSKRNEKGKMLIDSSTQNNNTFD